MKWLIAFLFFLLILPAEIVAQEVSATLMGSASSLGVAFPLPEPHPQMIPDDSVRDTWEVGLGYALVGFRSSPFTATMSGLNTTISYYFRDHLAAEGSFTSAFGSQSSSSASARYLFYGAGLKVSMGQRKLQPFAHALLGGVHLFPQIASGNNGFALQLGAGVERRLRPRIWLRLQGDYVRSQLYASGQNNFQAVAGINYRF
jgi:hypothetical protein